MAQFLHPICGASVRNPLNVLSLSRAENNPLGTWVNHTVATAIPAQTSVNSVPSPYNGYSGAPDSPWGWGNHLKPNTGGTYYTDSETLQYTANLLVLSIWVRRSSVSLPTVFTLGFETVGGPAETHGHRFSWSNSLDNWTTNVNFGGARGWVDPVQYDGNWRRVCIYYQIGWDTGAPETATLTTDTYGYFFYPGNNTECDVWGLMLERRTPVTGGTSAFVTMNVMSTLAAPNHYISDLWGRGAEGPMVFDCARESYSPGKVQVSMTGTSVDAGVAILRKVSAGAPWELAVGPKVEGDLNADGTVTADCAPYPRMRVSITELNNLTTAIGAAMME